MKIIKISAIARWFGEPCRWLELDEEAITIVRRDGKRRRFAFAELGWHPRIKRGWWFGKIGLETPSGLLWIRGLKTRMVEEVSRDLRCGWYRAAAPEAGRIANQIKGIIEQGYLRSGRLNQVQTLSSQALEKFGEPPPDLLPADIAAPFLYIRQVADRKAGDVDQVRGDYIARKNREFLDFFDRIESNPLTPRQREACIIDEENNLVVAGAGTGKTSTMIGRAGYLVASGQAGTGEILLLAFGRKAAEEMQQRLDQRLKVKGIKASTFHALGLKIIAQVEGARPSLSKMAEDEKLRGKWVDTQLNQLLTKPWYRILVLRYLEDYLYPALNPFDFDSEGAYLESIKANKIRTLKGEQVKSYEECLIANFLFRLGIAYAYEAPYKVVTRTPDFRQYQPDFYVRDSDVYIEHFGIDRDGNTAPWVNREQYQLGMDWKRALHERHGTVLIETYHWENREGCLLKNLEEKLRAAGVEPESVAGKMRAHQ